MKIKNKRISLYFYNCIVISSLLSLTIFTSCEDFVNVELPPDFVNTQDVFNSEGSAQAAMRGIYAYTSGSNAIQYMFTYVGLASDELERTSYSAEQAIYANNSIPSTSSSISSIWRGYYNIIYQCNNLIINVSASSEVSDEVKDQLVGEAKFMRAFSYFYLVNLWGDVPLSLVTDYDVVRLLPRASIAAVYEQIEADLLDAQSKLSGELYTTPEKRTRANKWAATALLARVMLYQEKWNEAEAQATTVINTEGYRLQSLDSIFYATSQESILQLANGGTNRYTSVGLTGSSVTNPSYRVRSFVADAISVADKRRAAWLTPTLNGAYKYKAYSNTRGPEEPEANIVLRLAEMYLIRAEARAQQGNVTGDDSAESDLNEIRSRAGLAGTDATTKPDMLEDIYTEKMREFFGEWGHRWFDVKRIGRADAIFGAHKDNWETGAALFPIPFDDLQRNPNLNP